jgi:hypothetical protein
MKMRRSYYKNLQQKGLWLWLLLLPYLANAQAVTEPTLALTRQLNIQHKQQKISLSSFLQQVKAKHKVNFLFEKKSVEDKKVEVKSDENGNLEQLLARYFSP